MIELLLTLSLVVFEGAGAALLFVPDALIWYPGNRPAGAPPNLLQLAYIAILICLFLTRLTLRRYDEARMAALGSACAAARKRAHGFETTAGAAARVRGALTLAFLKWRANTARTVYVLFVFIFPAAILYVHVWKAMLIPFWWGNAVLVMASGTVLYLLAFGWEAAAETPRNIRKVGISLVALVTLAVLPSGVNRAYDLSAARLAGADMRGIDLTRADAREAGFTGADFEEAVLTRTDFRNADLRGANFQYARLPGTRFSLADLSHADFTGALLAGTRLDSANLTGADFTEARLYFTRFGRATLRGAQFHSAILDRCDLRKADARMAVFHGADLVEGRFKEANFEHANLRSVDASESEWIQAILRHADLTDADFHFSNFAAAQMQSAVLAGTDLRQSVFVFADLTNARFERALLGSTLFYRANLQGADFKDAHFEDVDLRGADLRGVKNLTTEQLSHACGDAETQLPPGLTVAPCKPGREIPKFDPNAAPAGPSPS